MREGTLRQRAGWRFLLPGCLASVCLIGGVSVLGEEPLVRYGRDVRPIVSDRCFACHGPDEAARKGDLRLDRKDDVLRERDGHAVVVPGDAELSELIFRVESDDPSVVMPPPDSGKSITPEEVALLRKWVEQGAAWQEHWAFQTPVRPEPPEVHAADWPRSAIDRFILARLEELKLTPEPETPREAYIRRVTLDLTGLPPTPQEIDAFLADESQDAYETLVDRLLASPRYGEQMARYWLDAARYGDTHGLHLDNYREMWPYRDWVIRAWNQNLPFDQFLTWQLAGDMLPGATLDQQIASGFNRAHVTTNEGGSIQEEVYMRNVVDRVDTVATVMLGLTVACARCHDHKFDPITSREYYGLFGVFNSLDENAMDGNAARHAPIVQVPSPEQLAEGTKLELELQDVAARIRTQLDQVSYDEALDAAEGEYPRRADHLWVDDALPDGATPTAGNKAGEGWSFVGGVDHPVQRGMLAVRQQTAADTMLQQFFTGATRGLTVGPDDSLFAYVFIDPLDPPREIMLQWHSDGWKHRAYWGQNIVEFGKDQTTERHRVGELPRSGEWVRLEVSAQAVGIEPGTALVGVALTQQGGTVYWDSLGINTWTPQPGATYHNLASWVRDQKVLKLQGLPAPVQKAIETPREARTEDQRSALLNHYIEHAHSPVRTQFAALHVEQASLEASLKTLNEAIPTTLVSKERAEPRPSYLLARGEYDQQGDEVPRATPAFLPPPPAGQAVNRLTLAQWLVTPEHPLTARVAVNRFWLQLFGTGLVRTAEDFGAQGEPPSHSELLDWLAVEFRESGWDVKHLMREIVLSAAYRQSSRVTPAKRALDPENRLVSRGPRFRLDAEALRDQALYVSGLLVERQGGPSVKPPQPPGLWEAVGYTSSNTAQFEADKGPEKVHRRSLYTFWKRTSAPPQMNTLDAPSRETCTVRRERTNTPLQALLLLNDTQYVECARALAQRAMTEGGATVEDRLRWMFRTVVGRAPDVAEVEELSRAYQDFLGIYQSSGDSAQRLIAIGIEAPDASLKPSELAAWTLVGNILLNLDEVLTKG